eukprot:1159114-Pelagomonas_calceolata.AAC.7
MHHVNCQQVRSEARGREPTRLSTAALESMPGSILVDKQAVFAEAEEWLQTAGSNKPASFSTWRGQRQLQRFIQPALEERSMARKRRGWVSRVCGGEGSSHKFRL